ncbi:sensor histidine kinase [Devosia chinhatensis]|uniref:Blue-light-activated histidine kinase n=1 Tax=Devosia chinhatensis TaxID=429727 RepID=A0A0F5FN99_9HYPH|nr:PAS domain-containing protein [Devosia chinhatensis]KKB10020.1 hypothetical protein VE26_09515 [Devosia chinhatensis]
MNAVDYAAVFEALPSPFMIIDRDLRYVALNQAYLDTLNRARSSLIGEYLFDMFPNDDESGKRLKQSFDRVLATGEADTLAYLPYPIAMEDGTIEHRYWTAVHVPLFGDDGSVAFIMQNTVDVTEFARIREAATLPFHSLSAATRLIERTREADAASADFRRLFQQAPGFFAVLSGSRHVFTFASDSYVRLVGGRQLIGLPVAAALPEVEGQGFVALLDKVFREGYTHQAEEQMLMLQREPSKDPEETFLDFSYHPIRDSEGRISGIFVQGTDRTETVRAARRQRLLIDELNHRVKNTLATVQSIASQTLRNTNDIASAKQAFEARIIALSKAHNMLSERQWHDTEIGHLVCQELSAYDSALVQFGGPVLQINAKATVALALVLHELATNAAKHGALSAPEGRLSVNWAEDDADNLIIEWQESGGPPAHAPSRTGFGSRLLRTVITGELTGQLEMNYAEKGLSARMVIPPSAYCARVQEIV